MQFTFNFENEDEYEPTTSFPSTSPSSQKTSQNPRKERRKDNRKEDQLVQFHTFCDVSVTLTCPCCLQERPVPRFFVVGTCACCICTTCMADMVGTMEGNRWKCFVCQGNATSLYPIFYYHMIKQSFHIPQMGKTMKTIETAETVKKDVAQENKDAPCSAWQMTNLRKAMEFVHKIRRRNTQEPDRTCILDEMMGKLKS
jgi:hypothetical protein